MSGSVSLINGHIDKPTNYDRIRNMSVEELARFIMHIEKDIFNQTIIEGKILFTDNDFYEWLEAEVTE